MIASKKKLAIEKWNLQNVIAEYETDTRGVYYATSTVYGPVVLKINLCKDYLEKEFNTLREFAGGNCCKVYDYHDGLLLEEQIVQSEELNRVAVVDERLKKFAEAFCRIHCETGSSYPSYIDWLESADAWCRANNSKEALSHKMHLALQFGKEMFEKYPERLLLHGDLHHENILLGVDGNCKIIDPKGVIGPAVFDIPRFVLNELDPDINPTGEVHIRYVIRKLSELLGFDEADIKKLFFMETMLANIWCLEDGEAICEEDIAIAERILTD